MKDIRERLITLLRNSFATPQIGRLAKKLKEPASTIHYNLKKLEQEGKIKTYKAVFDHASIEEGFCIFILINLSPNEYGDPERIAKDLVKHPEIESINVITGDWEMLVKVRVKNQDAYYAFLRNVISRKGIEKVKSLTSLKELKSEFVSM
jgi:Lrp/AsnC family transcriptional regulator, leucine-responsive regulatory protein